MSQKIIDEKIESYTIEANTQNYKINLNSNEWDMIGMITVMPETEHVLHFIFDISSQSNSVILDIRCGIPCRTNDDIYLTFPNILEKTKVEIRYIKMVKIPERMPIRIPHQKIPDELQGEPIAMMGWNNLLYIENNHLKLKFLNL